MESLHAYQSACRGQVGLGTRLGVGVFEAVGPVVRQEVGKVNERSADASGAVFFQCVSRGEDQGIQLAKAAVDRTGVTPGLRRPVTGGRTSRAGASGRSASARAPSSTGPPRARA
jgi:short-subunit dehydrogenase involved in D-alanine esterification of teichoic acids